MSKGALWMVSVTLTSVPNDFHCRERLTFWGNGIMYSRPQNRRGDARHPPFVRTKDTRSRAVFGDDVMLKDRLREVLPDQAQTGNLIAQSRMMLPPSLQGALPAGWLAFTGRESNPLDHDEGLG
jgi:hypothetical protein